MRFAGAFLLLILFGIQGIIILQNEETNRLLSTFQRIDTVKADFSSAMEEQHYETIGENRKRHRAENLHDPNTCALWTSDCQGDVCDSVCHLKSEP